MSRPGSLFVRWGAGVLALGAVLVGIYAWLGPDYWLSPVERARLAYDQGQFQEAKDRGWKILLKEPGDRPAMRVIARASARLGDDETAQQLYGGIGDARMEAEDFFLLGSGLERRQMTVEALAVLERGRKLDPSDPETLHALARLYARAERLPEAIDAARVLARCPGWEARGSLILGVLASENADPPAAADALLAAFRADPLLKGGMTSPDQARKLMARTRLQASEPDVALATLEPLLKSSNDWEVSWLASRAYLQRRELGPAIEALKRAGDFTKDDPTRPEPAVYVGSSTCAQCHPAIVQAQRSGRHARTFWDPSTLKSLKLPEAPFPDATLPETTHTLTVEGQGLRLTTRSKGREMSAPIAFAVGSGDRGLTMVARDDSGLLRVCRVSSYKDNTLWDMTSHAAEPHPDDPDGPLGRPMSSGAAEKCMNCHLTSLRSTRDRLAPEALNRGISCERCHGPAGNHLIAMPLKFPEPAIARPSRASADQITKLCGTCHQADDASTRETDPRFVRFQASTLPRSRCYSESAGSLSCVTCHDPHRDAERRPEVYDRRCLSCHDPKSKSANDSFRRVPCPVKSTSNCVSCHMPKVEGAAPHASFTDHQIRTHRASPVDEVPPP